MICRLLTAIFVLIGHLALSQFQLRPIHYPDADITQVINGRTSGSDTLILPLQLPIWDDFSQSVSVPDSCLWEIGATVYINSEFGLNAPSYQVATFDGLNELGQAYDLEESNTGKGDSLISHPINLSDIENPGSIFLSFFWQSGGRGEQPDAGDSLRLQFLSVDSTWVSIWQAAGGTHDSSFHYVILPVTESRFHHDNFRMKFESFGQLTGPFDTWNIDYVYLNDNRNIGNTYHRDRTISSKPTSLFAPYTAIPLSHYTGNSGQHPPQKVTLGNWENPQNVFNPVDLFRNIYNDITGELLVNDFVESAIDAQSTADITLPAINLIVSDFDSLVIREVLSINSGDTLLEESIGGSEVYDPDIDFRLNDEFTFRYVLHDYFAYDDGSAEFVAGVNVLNSQLAVRFVVQETSVMSGLRIFIPNIQPVAAGQTIEMRVWSRLDDNGLIKQQSLTVPVPPARNEFIEINFAEQEKIPVRDTFYIGFIQLIDGFMGIGFDRNNTQATEEIFFNTSGEWIQNTTIKGALMIRPVFDIDIPTGIPEPAPSAVLYPNPASDQLFISGDYQSIQIYNLAGRLLYKSDYRDSHPLSELTPATYLVRLLQGNQWTTQKLIISR